MKRRTSPHARATLVTTIGFFLLSSSLCGCNDRERYQWKCGGDVFKSHLISTVSRSPTGAIRNVGDPPPECDLHVAVIRTVDSSVTVNYWSLDKPQPGYDVTQTNGDVYARRARITPTGRNRVFLVRSDGELVPVALRTDEMEWFLPDRITAMEAGSVWKASILPALQKCEATASNQ
mgnify:CR=1 FL=1